jgi:iron complex outermembrane receptor protein
MHGRAHSGPVSRDPNREGGAFRCERDDAVIESLHSLLAATLLALSTPALAVGAELLVPLAAADSLAPDTTARPVRTLAPVEVEAERARLDARRRMPTGAVSELVAGASNRALETVPELLASSVGARVVTYGGLGAFSTISLRGAAPGQVSVFLDGMPLTSAAHGVVDLADLPLGSIDRIEVYRGSAPLAFGPATPGGAVNLVSVETPKVRALKVARGSYDTWTSTGTAGGAHGALAWLANAGYEGSRGDFAYRTDNDTPYNLADDYNATRINDRYDASNALARLGWHRGAVRASLRAEGFHKAQGIPGRGAAQAPNPRLALDRGLLALEAGRAPAPTWPGVTLRLHGQDERSRFRDPEGELHLGRQDGTSHFGDSGGELALATPTRWRWLTADAALSRREENAHALPLTLGQPVPPESRRTTDAADVTLRLHAPAERLVVQAARRWDRQRDRVRATLVGGVPYVADGGRTLNAPQLGARASLPAGLAARANWSKSSRAPEFTELFGDLAIVAPNPKLAPERAESWDVGGGWDGAHGAWSAGATYAHFASHERNLIGYVPAAARTVRATNFSRAEIEGDELEAHAGWRWIAAAGSAAWTSARQTDTGNIWYGRRLPLRPERQAAARVDARVRRWRLSADVLDLGEDFLDPINFQRLPPRTIVGAAIACTVRAVTLTLEYKNLGDARVSDVAGYPIPGRSVFVAAELHGPSSTPRN